MMERYWKGNAKKERAKEDIDHLQNDTFKQMATMPGFISVKIFKRNIKEGIEFLIVTEWQNIDVIKRFAGSKLEMAVVPDLVKDMMVLYDEQVRHYEIIALDITNKQ